MAAQPSTPQRTLRLVARVEPGNATPRVDQSSGIVQDMAARLFVAGLVYLDDQEVPHPYLAEEVPQLNTATWQVFPDGRMETTYKLRPNLTWHDGAPLTAQDFLFALRLYQDPAAKSIFKASVESFIEDMQAPDDRTIVFKWNAPYALAAQQGTNEESFHPMPRHLLEAALTNDPSSIPNLSYWTQQFIGTGPYKLERWETGAFIEGSAFDGHALGRPKIDRVRFSWISDPNTTLANLLSGDVDFAADGSLEFQQALILKRDWAAQGLGTVILNTRQVRYVQIQARPELANPAALTDVRARQAMSFASDRQALVDGMLEGQGVTADTIVSPDVEYYPRLDRVLSKYPYDPNRVASLLGELGYTKGTDGLFTSPTAGKFSPELRGLVQNETAILADGWRRAGIDVQISITPPALQTNNEYRSQFPAFAITNSSLPDTTAVTKYGTVYAATPENRYGGTNKGGYSNPEYDRLVDGFNKSLDRVDREGWVIQMMKLASEQVPALPLYYDQLPTVHTSALVGPNKSAPGSLNYWNIHEWTWK